MVKLTDAHREQLEALRRAYRGQIADKVSAIGAAVAALLESWETPRLEALHERVHRLAGSSAIYGFASLGQAAARLEDFLVAAREGDAADRGAREERLQRLLSAVREAAEEELRPA